MLRYWIAPWTALAPRTALLQSAPRAVQRLTERSFFCRMRQRGAPRPEKPGKEQAGKPLEPQRVASGRRHVTTAFVQRPDDGRVLLVQRSERVSTYQFQWGGVSGGIELSDASPIVRALCEVEEEVGLRPWQLQFVRGGRPLYVDDGPHHFTVHPFLFRLHDPVAEVSLNWENVDARWVAPGDIGKLATVPQLVETWARTDATALGQEAALQALASDRTHGAAELAEWALAALERADADSARRCPPGVDGAPLLEALRNFGYLLATCRPGMAPIANATAAALASAHRLLHDTAGAFPVTAGEVCSAISEAVQEERERMQAAALDLRRRVRGLLGDRNVAVLLTHSLSSTVLRAVREAAEVDGLQLRAIVCESRPLFEGVALAEAWAAAGVRCTLITDAQAAVWCEEADAVLVGADAVLEDGSVVNKVGTYSLALVAREKGVPCYAVADSAKISAGSVESFAYAGCGLAGGAWREGAEEKEPGELSDSWRGAALPESVEIRNVYFEPTPRPLFTGGLISEQGDLSAEDIRRAVQSKRDAYMAAFQLLDECPWAAGP